MEFGGGTETIAVQFMPAARAFAMTNDVDWVEDVRRWCFTGGRTAIAKAEVSVTPPSQGEVPEIGYDAASPALQSPAWQKPMPSEFGALG